MPDSLEVKLWEARGLGFSLGVMSLCLGLLLMLFVGLQLGVIPDIVLNEDGPPWKILVTAAMITLPYKAAKRWGLGKKPDGT